MRKIYFTVFLVLSLLVYSVMLVGCNNNDNQAITGQVTAGKNDDAAIKEVINSYYEKTKNFNWENLNIEAGLELWTDSGKKATQENDLPKLKESILRQKITTKLSNVEIVNIKIEGTKAVINVNVMEEVSSLENEVLNGKVQSQDIIELQKENDIWRINKRNSQMLIMK